MFPALKYVSAIKQKHTLLLETMLPVWQNWETSRKDVATANVSGNVSPHFGTALVVSVWALRASFFKGVPAGSWVF